MNWATFIEAVRLWLATATGLKTILMYQAAPRPAYPYAAMHFDGERKIGVDEVRWVSTGSTFGKEMVPTVYGNRVMTIACETIVDTDTPSVPDNSYMSLAYASLRALSVLDAFFAKGIGVVRASKPVHFHDKVNQRWVTRWRMEVEFSVILTLTDTGIGYIQAAEIAETFLAPDGTISEHAHMRPMLLVPTASGWLANHAYAVGTYCKNDTSPLKYYLCVTAGTSDTSGGPTGTGADIVDHDAHWHYIAPVGA